MEMALKIAELETLPISVLQKRWKEFFGTKCDSNNKEYYVSRIAYKMQELELGGLSQATQKVIPKLFVDSTKHKPLPPPGTRIIREYHGVEHTVKIWADGFEYNGLKYKTLSSIATKITGHKVSGTYFFGLDKGV